MATRAKRQKLNRAEFGFIDEEDGSIRIEDIIIPAVPPPALSGAVPKTRLIITNLIIKNFKSYAEEHVLGPLDKNFTAVVGPNGSGKSNVLEALLFVFGSKAKKIRSKKVSQLIHNSDDHPDFDHCTVTIKFATIREEGSKYETIPGSEFSFSRTAQKDDTSYYEIGNKRVPFREVAKALKGYGIDLDHNRFVMLQGEIEQVAEMRPKAANEHDVGLLEYVEEIIGSNRFIKPINIFRERVQKLKETQKEKEHVVKLVEKEKKDLEQPKNIAIEYLRLSNELVVLENSLLHIKSVDAEEELNDTVESKKKFTEKVNGLKKELNDLKLSKKSSEGNFEQTDKEIEGLQKCAEELKEKFKFLERQDILLSENIKHAKSKLEKHEGSLTSAKKELAKFIKQSAVYENETAELEIRKKKLEAEKKVEEEKNSEVMGSLTQELKTLQEKQDKYEAKIVQLKNKAYDIKSEVDLLHSELQIHTSVEKKEKDALSSLTSNLEKLEALEKEEEKLLKQEENLISKTEAELSDLNQQLLESRENERTFNQQHKMCRLKYEDARSSRNSVQNRGAMFTAFLREKANGRLTGVYGRLGDLGAIDEKYDIAISTACGQLDNIVTDTINTAQQCVQFLKKNNLGYTTFIPLDKMTRWQQFAYKKIETPENVPRLYDLVRVKDKSVLPAFYFALRDTLVANDLGQATRIGLQGKYRYRVVTLNGELIDLSGTMSGGGRSVQKGRMGSSIVECTYTSEDISKMEVEVRGLAKSIANVKKIILSVEDQMGKKKKELSTLMLSVKKRKLNHKSCKEKIKMVEKQIEEQKKKLEVSSVDMDKVKELEEQIQEKTQKYLKASSEATAGEEELKIIKEEIFKISKGKLNKVKKNYDQLIKKFNEVSQTIAKSSVNIKSSRRNIKKTEEKISNIEKNILEDKELIQSHKDERNALTLKGQKVHDRKEKTEEEINVLKKKRAGLKKQLEDIKEKEHKMKSKEIELVNELKKYEARENEKKAVIRSIKNKLAKLKLHVVENDSVELPSLSLDEIKALSPRNITRQMDAIQARLNKLKPCLSAIQEYKEKEKEFLEKKQILDEVTKDKDLQNKRYEELRSLRLHEFVTGFDIIAEKLKETYQMLALGGDAELELIESYDPFTKGIELSVRPPKKSWKTIKNLSGGEKTLSSLAVVFATHYYRPSPIYIMDEVDAALDETNVGIVGLFLKKRTKNTQLIIVSLRNPMSELSDYMLGIYKTKNCSGHTSISHVERWNQAANQPNSEETES